MKNFFQLNRTKIVIIISILFVSCSSKTYFKEYSKIEIKCGNENEYFFVNGIFNSREDAERSAVELSKIYKKDFSLVFNNSDGFKSIRAIKHIKTVNKLGTDFSMQESDDAILKQYLKDRKKIFTEDDFKEMRRVYNSIKDGFSPLIVSHSHGNVFANEICISSKEKIKTIHIANPTNVKTECELKNISFKNDLVLKTVETALFSKVRERLYTDNYDKPSLHHGLENHLNEFNLSRKDLDKILIKEKTQDYVEIKLWNGNNTIKKSISFLHNKSQHNSLKIDCKTEPGYIKVNNKAKITGGYQFIADKNRGGKRVAINKGLLNVLAIRKELDEDGGQKVVISPAKESEFIIDLIKSDSIGLLEDIVSSKFLDFF